MARNAYTKVLIIDDHPIYSIGLSTILESSHKYNIVGITSNLSDAVKIIEKDNPRLVFLEINLGKENGMDIIQKLKSISPQIIILVLTSSDERFYSERVLRMGARGYIMKTENAAKIMDAVNTVLDGKIYLSESERDRVFQAMTQENSRGAKDWTMSLQKLSNRELQVFSLIGKGLGTIEIASMFNISTKTIDSHKEHIKLKLHCSTSQELRQMAIQWISMNG
ncbi:MAG: response regulator transcription factor [Treponema sp.]|nr:response regulator transcription factor [Treponema sp.]